VLAGLAVALAAMPAAAAIIDTPHNLSATGPGPTRSGATTEICIFCHTPHRAATTRALWNRDLPPVTYTLYTSSTLGVPPAQPTGATRLCLSCHDGTTALGLLRVPPARGRSTLGRLTGRAALGTDLSDDHPVSLEYDAAVARAHGELTDSARLPHTLPLDATRQLQCTTCHDPHENRFRAFLRVDDTAGALCTACHRLPNWPTSSHARATATWNGRGVDPWPTSPFTRVADNACESCHRPHNAPRPVRLLAQPLERNVCLVCHNGNVARTDIEGELGKASVHPVAATDGVHDPTEDPRSMPRHVTCVDCHNPHQVDGSDARAPAASGRYRGVSGVNLGGQTIDEVQNQYEVCFKCHGLRDQTTRSLVRLDNVRNVRLEVSPGNASYHPVAAPGRNPTIADLEPGLTPASLIYCTDCHNTDNPRAPRGPHGSRFAPILERNFTLDDPSVESPDAYALCYKCHTRAALIGNLAGKFPHAHHLQVARASCGVCHDAHGSRQNPHLINFMLRDPTGRPVVGPSRILRRLEYQSPRPGGGPGSGQCFLECHGMNHEPFGYG
jgi:predicted CXXCH cytochrome family protein